MYKALLGLLCCTLFAIPAAASTLAVGYSTTGAGPFSFQADTFSLSGQSGSLNLDTVAITTQNINSATFFTGNSGSFNGSQTLNLAYGLTLDGVTHTVTQTATWTISPSLDTFITVGASSPVLFVTPAGTWDVTLNAYSLTSTIVGLTQTKPTPAAFAPIPEPSSLVLLGTGLLGVVGAARRKWLG